MLRRNTNHVLVKFLIDTLVTLGAVMVAFWLRGVLQFGITYAQTESDRITFTVCALVYPVVYFLFGLYDPERTYRSVDEFQTFTVASIFAGLSLAGLIHFVMPTLSRLFLVYFYVVQFVMMCSWMLIYRILLRNRRRTDALTHRIVLVGGGMAARQVLERLHAFNTPDLKIVGYLTDGNPIPEANGTIPKLGGLNDVASVVAKHQVDDVLLAMPAESYSDMQKLMEVLASKPCNVWVVPDYFSVLLYGSRVAELAGVPMISLKAPSLSGNQRMMKRGFDLAVGGLMTLFALPILLPVAIAIKLSSPGPVFYKQKRVGEGGRLFDMYKFRSMVVNADKHEHTLLKRDAEGRLVHEKTKDDPRVTRIGRFIRRTSIDELPQLLNILKGDMSLVGPRPELPSLVEHYEMWQRRRFAVPQGLTGWWQVNGRSDKPTHMKVEDDLYYIQNYSLLLDLQIMLKTVWVVLHGRGAY